MHLLCEIHYHQMINYVIKWESVDVAHSSDRMRTFDIYWMICHCVREGETNVFFCFTFVKLRFASNVRKSIWIECVDTNHSARQREQYGFFRVSINNVRACSCWLCREWERLIISRNKWLVQIGDICFFFSFSIRF